MIENWKEKLEAFLWDDTSICEVEDMKLISDWVEKNVMLERDDLLNELMTHNTNLINSLESLNVENRDLMLTNEILKSLLKKSVEVIKQWHHMGAARFRTKEVIEETWHLYYNNAPEMKEIREALKEEL